MTRVKKLEQEVRELTPEELKAFRQWFQEYDAESWDREIENDIRAGRLARLASEAIAEHRAGRTTEL
ncbi:MAG: hypothetical protein FJZ95_08585 [Chloroflexi bacterium]|nr:hypothetical protein [Chloroflexota bacterium]